LHALIIFCRIISLNIPDNKDNKTLVDIKNNCWKGSTADWVIVIDTDEFIYHPQIRNILASTNATIMRTTWCEMYSDKVPCGDGQIYEVADTDKGNEVVLQHIGKIVKIPFI